MDKLIAEACKNTNGTNALYWWCAPTYARAGKAFDLFLAKLKPIIDFSKTRRNEFIITLLNGVVIEFVSLEKWENRKGDGLDGVVIDEAARCPARAWTELIRPALSDKKGWAWLISTPLGRNWFFHEWKRGQNPAEQAMYASFRCPTSDNPYIDPAEIREAKRTLPEDVFEQEYEAKFLEEGAGVFRGLALCKPTQEELHRGYVCIRPKNPDEVCTLGVDLGKHQDYTVLNVLATAYAGRHRQIYGEQFNKMDWLSQQERIVEVARAYNAVIWMDVSGPGDRMYEDLVRAGLRVESLKFSSPMVRTDILKTLQVEISNGRIGLNEQPLSIFLDMWTQLQNFEYRVSPSGNLLMGPPDGEHDDWVMSLGAAIYGAVKNVDRADLTLFAPERQAKIHAELAQNPGQLSNILGLPFLNGNGDSVLPESRFSDFGSMFPGGQKSYFGGV